MSDILELIKSRRNVTQFLPKFVSWENISRVLDAGRHAPSCGNIQNWKFIVVLKPELKQEIAAACYDQYEIAQAFVLIAVCAEPEKAERYYGEKGKKFYTVQNCAAAVQTMLLEAQSLGLSTRWIGAFDEEKVNGLLGIPAEVEVHALVALGYAKDIPPKPPKYPLETLIYFGAWRAKIADPAKYLNDIATILARKAHAATEMVHKGKELVTQKAKELVKK
ncbi:MAG TPA: nitroreductase family protein [Candidatus Nanoarchaeia archaeon]|nr:nitroreductase family protein [Candidatus Nanoarchaeia archaeon]